MGDAEKLDKLETEMKKMSALLLQMQAENTALRAEQLKRTADEQTAEAEELERLKELQDQQNLLQNYLADRETAERNIEQTEKRITELTLVKEEIKLDPDADPSLTVAAGGMTTRGPQEKIDMTFGEDTSAKMLRTFISHYRLVRAVNRDDEKFVQWQDTAYRAKKLKLVLRGEAGEYISNEESMGKIWVNDDDEILQHLLDRYSNTQMVELNIMEFEKAVQKSNEPLCEFLSRVQRLALEAFEDEPKDIREKRIAWRFLSGILDTDVRTALIKEGWMIDKRTPKSPEEILKIAESTRQRAVAGKAIAPQNQAAKAAMAQSKGKKTIGKKSYKQNERQTSTYDRVFQCYYCEKEHKGGWKDCPKRLKDAPDWKPEFSERSIKNKPGF